MTATAENQLVTRLVELLGPRGVVAGDDAAPLLTDLREVYTGSALAVLRPASTEEVAAVVQHCARAGVAIATQGGNTGMSGGATPDPARPSVLVSLTRMNRIEALEPDRWAMTVEAGATVQAVQEAAAGAGRLFAPDWGARGTATIGGAVATNAGGNNVLRYGNIRDNVMGLEVVLADGRVWDGCRTLRKDSSGYDLKQLFIGSEGTLGIVTRAVLKLHPPTTHVQSALAAVVDLAQLNELYAMAHDTAPGVITAFELVPDVGIDRVCEVYDLSRPLATRAEFYVLVKAASTRPVTDLLAGFLASAADAGLISDAIVASTPEQEERLWMIHDELSPSRIYRHRQAIGLKMDTAVPVDRMAEYHDIVRSLAAEIVPGALAYGFGHVGDGNIHMMVLPVDDEQVEPFLARRAELEARIDEATFAMGGTLSAEHGIGQVLRDRIGPQKPAIEWELMRTVKAALDPADLLNPGKMLPEPGL